MNKMSAFKFSNIYLAKSYVMWIKFKVCNRRRRCHQQSATNMHWQIHSLVTFENLKCMFCNLRENKHIQSATYHATHHYKFQSLFVYVYVCIVHVLFALYNLSKLISFSKIRYQENQSNVKEWHTQPIACTLFNQIHTLQIIK